MGYWKDVWADMQEGMSRETAERINAILWSKTATEKEKASAQQEGEFEIELNKLP